jgi:hypothetical protein
LRNRGQFTHCDTASAVGTPTAEAVSHWVN